MAPPELVDRILSEYRIHGEAKTTREALLVDREYAAWMYRQLKDSQDEFGENVCLDYIKLQRSYRTLHEHPVISRVAKLWKKHINNKIFINKDY